MTLVPLFFVVTKPTLARKEDVKETLKEIDTEL
jgi:hypothetical protein